MHFSKLFLIASLNFVSSFPAHLKKRHDFATPIAEVSTHVQTAVQNSVEIISQSFPAAGSPISLSPVAEDPVDDAPPALLIAKFPANESADSIPPPADVQEQNADSKVVEEVQAFDSPVANNEDTQEPCDDKKSKYWPPKYATAEAPAAVENAGSSDLEGLESQEVESAAANIPSTDVQPSFPSKNSASTEQTSDISGVAGSLTWNSFEEGGSGGGAAACDGKFHDDSGLIVAVSTNLFANGDNCGKTVTINVNNKSVQGVIVDMCDTARDGCASNLIDGSPGLWAAAGLNLDVGVVAITFSIQ